jgi:hypothetical protein
MENIVHELTKEMCIHKGKKQYGMLETYFKFLGFEERGKVIQQSDFRKILNQVPVLQFSSEKFKKLTNAILFHLQSHDESTLNHGQPNLSMLTSLQASSHLEIHPFFSIQHQKWIMEMSQMRYMLLISELDKRRRHFVGIYSTPISQKGLLHWLGKRIFSPPVQYHQLNKGVATIPQNVMWHVKRRLMIFFSDKINIEQVQKTSHYLLGTYLFLHSGEWSIFQTRDETHY